MSDNVTYDINDVEIFQAGNWNGDTYTEKDLDDIVQSYQEIGSVMKPYVKLGHDKEQKLLQANGYPSAGWITGLKRSGEKLLADFKSVPAKIKQLIDAKAYGRVSSEIYWNLKNGDKTYPKVLKAVALLGGDTPAVGTLDDFINLYTESEFEGELHTYYEDNTMSEEIKVQAPEIDTLSNRVKELEAIIEEKEKNYTQLTAEHDELKGKYDGLQREGRQKEVNDYLSAKLAEGKIVPSQLAQFTALAMGDGLHEYELDNKKVSGSGFELVKGIIEANQKLVEFETKSTAEVPEKKLYSKQIDSDEKFDAAVKQYAKDNSVSYREAFRAIVNKGDE